MPELNTATIILSRKLKRSRVDCWKELTAGIRNWWPKDFYTGPYEKIDPVGIRLEPKVGGHFAEDWGGGDGLLWATVIACKQESMLLLVGDATSQWGGPNRTFTEFRLSDDGDGCEVKVSIQPWGVVSDKTSASTEAGWGLLMDAYAAWVNEGVHPERPATIS